MDDDNPLLTPLRRYSGYGTTARTAIFNYFPTHESLESLHRIVLKQKKTSPDHPASPQLSERRPRVDERDRSRMVTLVEA